MADMKQMKEDAAFIKKGLFKIGRNRVAALPVHKTWQLTDEMEERIARLVAELDKVPSANK